MLYPKIHAHFLFFPGLLSCFEIIVLFQSVTFRSDPLLLLKSECLLESQINSPFLLVKSPSQVKSPFFAGGSTVSFGRNLDVWPVKTLSEAPPWARSGCWRSWLPRRRARPSCARVPPWCPGSGWPHPPPATVPQDGIWVAPWLPQR